MKKLRNIFFGMLLGMLFVAPLTACGKTKSGKERMPHSVPECPECDPRFLFPGTDVPLFPMEQEEERKKEPEEKPEENPEEPKREKEAEHTPNEQKKQHKKRRKKEKTEFPPKHSPKFPPPKKPFPHPNSTLFRHL